MYEILSDYLIQERSAFSLVPLNLFPVGIVHNTKLYSSTSLKKEFKVIINDSKELEPVKNNLIKMVDKWKICPCYLSSNLIKLIIKKLKDSFLDYIYNNKSGTVAFYYADENRVYIPFDRQIGTTLNLDKRQEKYISVILLHELQHYCAVNLKQSYYSLFSKTYNTWYKHFFNYYFKTHYIQERDVKDISYFLAKNGDWADNFVSNTKQWFNEYYSLLDKLTTKYDLDKKKIQYLFNTLRTALVNYKQYSKEVTNSSEPALSLFSSAILAYREMKYKVNTLAYQELVYPSEISAMTCNFNQIDQKHYKAIQMLRI